MPREIEGGPCCAPLEEGGTCGVDLSSFWYGKRGAKFCASHRAAWEKSKNGALAGNEEEPSELTEMDQLLGTRYCEPAKMKRKERYNDIPKKSLEFCVQGTFNFDDDQRGHTDTRWQTLAELTEYCSREEFERLSGAYVKELQKTFKRDAKKFKTAAQLRAEE